MAKKWYDKVWEFFQEEPIYASRTGISDAGLAEGWKTAFEMERDKREVAEKRLTFLYSLADGIIDSGIHPQYGRDILTILTMTEEELDEDYGDD